MPKFGGYRIRRRERDGRRGFPISNREIQRRRDRPAARLCPGDAGRSGRKSRRFRFGVSVTATAFFPRGGISYTRRRFRPDMGPEVRRWTAKGRISNAGFAVDEDCKSRSDGGERSDFKSGLCRSGVDSGHSNGGGSFPLPFCKCPNVWSFAALAHCPHFKCCLSSAGQIPNVWDFGQHPAAVGKSVSANDFG